jgi:hypothetical protein
MIRKETKILCLLAVSVLVVFSFGKFSAATEYSSASYSVSNPVIDEGQRTSSSSNFGLGQSLSQTAIGKSTSGNFQLWSGFQYYFKVNTNVLTATAGDSKVDLSWTVPQTFLGIAVSSYEVGTGTVSGSYVFQSVGNVTSFTKSGLANGTNYFFIVKAKAASGLFLVYSNEATATPTGGGGGGGGGLTPPPPPPPPSGNGILIVKGLAYPSSQVTLMKDGAQVASTTADPGAAFNIQLSGLAAASYSFGVYSTDQTGQRSPTYTFSETFSTGVTITVDNIFLGPSIGLSHSVIKKGDTITAFGYTTPNSNVNVFINSSPEYIETVQSTTSGAWVEPFNTEVLDLGSHTSKSQAKKDSALSMYSNTLGFAVADKSLPIPDQCKRSDLNCDGRVNLTDFSILLFFWQQTNPSNKAADINKDGIVNLTDFSILLFDWTG